jgi:hypothetical protein
VSPYCDVHGKESFENLEEEDCTCLLVENIEGVIKIVVTPTCRTHSLCPCIHLKELSHGKSFLTKTLVSPLCNFHGDSGDGVHLICNRELHPDSDEVDDICKIHLHKHREDLDVDDKIISETDILDRQSKCTCQPKKAKSVLLDMKAFFGIKERKEPCPIHEQIAEKEDHAEVDTLDHIDVGLQYPRRPSCVCGNQNEEALIKYCSIHCKDPMKVADIKMDIPSLGHVFTVTDVHAKCICEETNEDLPTFGDNKCPVHCGLSCTCLEAMKSEGVCVLHSIAEEGINLLSEAGKCICKPGMGSEKTCKVHGNCTCVPFRILDNKPTPIIRCITSPYCEVHGKGEIQQDKCTCIPIENDHEVAKIIVSPTCRLHAKCPCVHLKVFTDGGSAVAKTLASPLCVMHVNEGDGLHLVCNKHTCAPDEAKTCPVHLEKHMDIVEETLYDDPDISEELEDEMERFEISPLNTGLGEKWLVSAVNDQSVKSGRSLSPEMDKTNASSDKGHPVSPKFLSPVQKKINPFMDKALEKEMQDYQVPLSAKEERVSRRVVSPVEKNINPFMDKSLEKPMQGSKEKDPSSAEEHPASPRVVLPLERQISPFMEDTLEKPVKGSTEKVALSKRFSPILVIEFNEDQHQVHPKVNSSFQETLDNETEGIYEVSGHTTPIPEIEIEKEADRVRSPSHEYEPVIVMRSPKTLSRQSSFEEQVMFLDDFNNYMEENQFETYTVNEITYIDDLNCTCHDPPEEKSLIAELKRIFFNVKPRVDMTCPVHDENAYDMVPCLQSEHTELNNFHKRRISCICADCTEPILIKYCDVHCEGPVMPMKPRLTIPNLGQVFAFNDVYALCTCKQTISKCGREMTLEEAEKQCPVHGGVMCTCLDENGPGNCRLHNLVETGIHFVPRVTGSEKCSCITGSSQVTKYCKVHGKCKCTPFKKVTEKGQTDIRAIVAPYCDVHGWGVSEDTCTCVPMAADDGSARVIVSPSCKLHARCPCLHLKVLSEGKSAIVKTLFSPLCKLHGSWGNGEDAIDGKGIKDLPTYTSRCSISPLSLVLHKEDEEQELSVHFLGSPKSPRAFLGRPKSPSLFLHRSRSPVLEQEQEVSVHFPGSPRSPRSPRSPVDQESGSCTCIARRRSRSLSVEVQQFFFNNVPEEEKPCPIHSTDGCICDDLVAIERLGSCPIHGSQEIKGVQHVSESMDRENFCICDGIKVDVDPEDVKEHCQACNHVGMIELDAEEEESLGEMASINVSNVPCTCAQFGGASCKLHRNCTCVPFEIVGSPNCQTIRSIISPYCNIHGSKSLERPNCTCIPMVDADGTSQTILNPTCFIHAHCPCIHLKVLKDGEVSIAKTIASPLCRLHGSGKRHLICACSFEKTKEDCKLHGEDVARYRYVESKSVWIQSETGNKKEVDIHLQENPKTSMPERIMNVDTVFSPKDNASKRDAPVNVNLGGIVMARTDWRHSGDSCSCIPADDVYGEMFFRSDTCAVHGRTTPGLEGSKTRRTPVHSPGIPGAFKPVTSPTSPKSSKSKKSESAAYNVQTGSLRMKVKRCTCDEENEINLNCPVHGEMLESLDETCTCDWESLVTSPTCPVHNKYEGNCKRGYFFLILEVG